MFSARRLPAALRGAEKFARTLSDQMADALLFRTIATAAHKRMDCAKAAV